MSLCYVDYIAREFIYRRHCAWFDGFGAGRTFLAEGYLQSAWAELARKERYRSLCFSPPCVRHLPEPLCRKLRAGSRFVRKEPDLLSDGETRLAKD
jgi:hypothetical protein